jgi:hypothetical protein
MKALRKNQKERLEIKNTNRRKDAFHELIISGPGTGMVSLREGEGGGGRGREAGKEGRGREGGRERQKKQVKEQVFQIYQQPPNHKFKKL